MIKNFCIYRVKPETIPSIQTIETALSEHPFAPCGNVEPERVGFVPALADDASSFVCTVGHASLIRLREQRRLLPAGVVREELEKHVSEVQEREGRKLRRKEIARLKDELTFSLLPRAFTQTSEVTIVLLPMDGLILVGTGSYKRAERALNALRLALGSLPVTRPAFAAPIASTLTAWLTDPSIMPEKLAVGESCELADAEGVVRCKGIDLVSSEVLSHLEAGREVRRLQMRHDDDLTFTVTTDARILQVSLSERSLGELYAGHGDDRLANLQAEFFLFHTLALDMLSLLLAAMRETEG